MPGHEDILRKFFERLYDFFGPRQWWPGETPFEVAVGAILTQNTNWGNVEKAINNLKRQRLLSARALNKMTEGNLSRVIKPAGYYNVKSKRLKSFVSFLVGEYRGSMRRMAKEKTDVLREKLLRINGIGPETADSILLYALEKPVFVIDAYTKRILSRHCIIGYDNSYDEFQELFHKSLQKDVKLYNEYHALLVETGKVFCKPGVPLCSQCPLNVFLR
ncbi:MAG: endonuclease III domain-containing protein [Nitrospirota bacterium]